MITKNKISADSSRKQQLIIIEKGDLFRPIENKFEQYCSIISKWRRSVNRSGNKIYSCQKKDDLTK